MLIFVTLLFLGILIFYFVNKAFSNEPEQTQGTNNTAVVNLPNDDKPCLGSSAPNKWRHVVVVMFENHYWHQVIGSNKAPYLSHLAKSCGTAYSGTFGSSPLTNWHDADYKVNGIREGDYKSKANYATLTTGLPPSKHGLTNDDFGTTTTADNIYKRLKDAGLDAKDYYGGSADSSPCTTANFSGAYHDAIRYYTPTIGVNYCNRHDVPVSFFIDDLNHDRLPNFSMVIPSNCDNMHACLTIRNDVTHGDRWAKSFLASLFNSNQFKSGDTAVFLLWDEDTPIPNVLIAPSVIPSSKVTDASTNPISHFSATRTWMEMLGIAPLGDSNKAPSLLYFFNGAINSR